MISSLMTLVSIFIANVENAVVKLFTPKITRKTRVSVSMPFHIPDGCFNPNHIILTEPKSKYQSPEKDINDNLTAIKAGLKIINESDLLLGRKTFLDLSE